jgi:hypothetical protein
LIVLHELAPHDLQRDGAIRAVWTARQTTAIPLRRGDSAGIGNRRPYRAPAARSSSIYTCARRPASGPVRGLSWPRSRRCPAGPQPW